MKKKLLKSLSKIYTTADTFGLDLTIFDAIKPELKTVKKYFNVNSRQAFFIANILSLSYVKDTIDLTDLVVYFECNTIDILQYSTDFDVLHEKRIIEWRNNGYGNDDEELNRKFAINKKIVDAILLNQPMPDMSDKAFEDVVDLLEKLDELAQKREDGVLSSDDFFWAVKKIIDENKHFPLIKWVYDFGLNTADAFLLLFLVWKKLLGNSVIDIEQILNSIFIRGSAKVKYMQDILSGTNNLVKQGLIEVIEAAFYNNADIGLSDYATDIIVEHGLKIRYARRRRKNVLKPEEIEKRELVFDPKEMEQLVMLEKLLQDKKLNETQKRLAQKNMPKGITVLLYGQPGTGKTESALQMCKSTGRELMKLDISQTKSMWFGQSEKIIKQVFTDYKEFAKESKRTPVLLFNEADAILSKRKDTNSSSTAQTENAIQNVLLEELENFEGILIATTNLHKNFDKAFERRFLFKIAFGKPGLDARKKIWRLKMPGLPATDYSALAKQFNFTGGQIDNIVRKYEIFKIVQNKKANLKQLERFCHEELLDGEIKKMGF